MHLLVPHMHSMSELQHVSIPHYSLQLFFLVRWLFSFGPTSATVLAESTAMDRSSVSRLVNQLKSLGYVKSEPSPDDRRGVLLSLTELGQQQTIDALKEKESAFYNVFQNGMIPSLKSLLKCLEISMVMNKFYI